MKFKRFLALTVVATMVAGSTLTAFASEPVIGQGVIEYDDSEDILYDSVTVPTLVASDYAFRIDAQQLMKEYNPDKYNANATVFFSSVKNDEKAKIKAAAGKTLYTKEYEVQSIDDGTSASPTWSNIVTTATADETTGEITITALAETKYFVWTPGDAYTGKAVSGYDGQFVELTKDNILNWFDIDSASSKKLSRKVDYRAGQYVCDGNIYKEKFTAVAAGGITDSDNDPVSKYYKKDGETVTISNLYEGTSHTPAVAADVVYTAPTFEYNSETKHVFVTNKSTKEKKLTIEVTLNNPDGLNIVTSNEFSADTKASLWTGVYTSKQSDLGYGETEVSNLSKDAETGKVSKKVEVTLAAATDEGVTTYQTSETNAITGGNHYGKYSGPDPDYKYTTFYIQAKANPNVAAKEAWNTYYATLTEAEKVPTYSIVYTLTNTDNSETGPEVDEEEPEVTPTAGTAKVTQSDGVNYLALRGADNARFEASATSVKVNDIDVTEYQTLIGGYVAISVPNLRTAGVTIAGGTKLTAVYVVDGTTYTAEYTP